MTKAPTGVMKLGAPNEGDKPNFLSSYRWIFIEPILGIVLYIPSYCRRCSLLIDVDFAHSDYLPGADRSHLSRNCFI